MSWVKRMAASPGVQRAIGSLAADYLRLVWKTSSFVYEPAEPYREIDPLMPVIGTMWHGQHFMMPFFSLPHHKAKTIISRHRDGEMNAVAAHKLGVGTIRGSGSHDRDFARKGGVAAFKQALDALEEGYNVVLTADVPKVSRVAGMGIIMLAKQSQRPIYGVAIATSRRKVLDNWDRTAVNLPFSRGAVVVTPGIRVPADADPALMDTLRKQLEDELNKATDRAYALVDRRKDAKLGQ